MKQLRLWVTGYRSYELGVFTNNDPKVKVIKYLLKKHFEQKFNDGLEWVITGGQLGVEQWAAEAAVELKEEYPELKVSLMYPFSEFGSQWNEQNRMLLSDLESKVDFCASISKQPYQSPAQLKNFQKFMLDHTDEATMIYDPEYPGKPKYDFQAIERYGKTHDYPVTMFEMDNLQDAANEFQENLGN